MAAEMKMNSTRTISQTAAATCVGESLDLPATLFESLEALEGAAAGGYSILTPLYGMGVAVFDRHPHAGKEDEDGTWQYTEVGVYPL